MFKSILIATDGSELAGKAVASGVELARSLGAKVTVITVTEPFHALTLSAGQLEDTPASYREHVAEHVDKTLGGAAGMAKAAGVACETVHVEDDDPYRAIIGTAQARACDLIVMASHGRRGVSAVVLGSETLKVLTHSAIPVLVLR